jgi:hypothetical protein
MKLGNISLAILLGSACAALAQGQITFGNRLPGLRAPIFGPELDWVNFGGDWANAKTGNTATGIPAGTQVYGGSLLESFVVSFWAGPGIVTSAALLVPSPTTTTLGTGSLAGYFPTTSAVFPSWVPPTGVVTVQVRVHDPSGLWAFGGYSPYGAVAAASALFTANIGSTATGLRSFSVGWLDGKTGAPYVPEPGSISILLFGAALLFRQSCKLRT